MAYAEGQTVVAQDLMRRYLASSSPQERNTQQRAEAERIVSQVQGQSAELLMQGDPETQVLLNGRLVGVLPLPMPLLLSAGPHVISWKSPIKTQEKAIEVEAHRAYLLAQDSSGAMEIKRLASLVDLVVAAIVLFVVVLPPRAVKARPTAASKRQPVYERP